ncbi:MAG: hypothetical protein U9R47_07530 [Actinomycetota bacterium]|nr:hypothetical protein [Actinomycetota bacterium]
MIQRRLRRAVTLLLAAITVSTIAIPAAAEDPSTGRWPIETQSHEVSGLPNGLAWVRSNPMLITSLSASMGTPPPGIVADYFGPFGATAKMLWQDGPAEVPGWQPGGSPNPFISWLRSDGTSSVWDPFLSAFESTGETLGGLSPDRPGRIGFQIGDEPGTITALDQIQAGIETVRAYDPDALVYVNLSVNITDANAVLDHWQNNVDADVLMMSDYFFNALHYSALETMRTRALAKGVPFWKYLNAYIGAESDRVLLHTESDLRWQAMVGLVYGYTGFSWFLYQAADGAQHPSATQYGGSVLFDEVGTWNANQTSLWGIVSDINEELANLGRAMTQLRSTDVRFIKADHPLATQPPLSTPWSVGAGGDPYLTAVGPAEGEPPMEIPIGFFVDPSGQHYVMVQNGRHTHSVAADAPPLPGADSPGRIRLEFDFTGAPLIIDRNRVEYLDPTDGKVKILSLLELPPPEEEPPPEGEPPPEAPEPNPDHRYAEPLLDPGEPLLFKYTNTIPFRLGPNVDGVGVVDTDSGIWHLRTPNSVQSFFYGNPGDAPFMGDWDCDGVDTPGLYRRSDGFVYLRNTNTQGIADVRFFFGNPGDLPLAGDFNGDGCDTVSIYRPDEGRVYVVNELGANDGGLGTAEFSYFFGNPGDNPFSGDFDGDGIDTVGLHRVSTGLIYLRNSHTPGNADLQYVFGDPGDEIVAGDWDGDGSDTPGLLRPSEARFYLNFEHGGGAADIDFLFGDPGWVPVAGHF